MTASQTNPTQRTLEIDLKAEKNRALGELVGAVAHELNSPLTGILVFAEALHRHLEEGSELKDQASEVVESAQRCRAIIQRILRVAQRSRNTGSRMTPDPAKLMRDVHLLLAHKAEMSRVHFEVECSSELQAVAVDVADLELILVDLLLRAITANAGSGDKLILKAKNTERCVSVEIVSKGKCFFPDEITQRPEILLYQRCLDESKARLSFEEAPGGESKARMVLPIGSQGEGDV
jgi:two-component system, NtrC family, sensor kinase